jgi:hypothetical protein
VTGQAIVEFGDDGYGPMNTRKFNKDSNVPVVNADQYCWFAQEYYWTVLCKKDYKAPKSNNDYLKCTDGSERCQVM